MSAPASANTEAKAPFLGEPQIAFSNLDGVDNFIIHRVLGSGFLRGQAGIN